MLLNFNMLINCQIIISMELNLNSILIFNELTKINLIVMNTNTFNDDWLLTFFKKMHNKYSNFLRIAVDNFNFVLFVYQQKKYLEGHFSPHLKTSSIVAALWRSCKIFSMVLSGVRFCISVFF